MNWERILGQMETSAQQRHEEWRKKFVRNVEADIKSKCE